MRLASNFSAPVHTKNSELLSIITLTVMNRSEKRLAFWNQHQKFYRHTKFHQSLSGWVNVCHFFGWQWLEINFFTISAVPIEGYVVRSVPRICAFGERLSSRPHCGINFHHKFRLLKVRQSFDAFWRLTIIFWLFHLLFLPFFLSFQLLLLCQLALCKAS